MHIDKFLCDTRKPSFLPGPFYARLKLELKQTYFDRKAGYSLHLIYSTAIVCLLVLCSFMILNPQTAQQLNTLVMGQSEDKLDMLLLAEKDIDLSGYPAGIKTISTEIHSAFPFIEEDKSYLVYKFTNHNSQKMIYINEVKRPQQARTLH